MSQACCETKQESLGEEGRAGSRSFVAQAFLGLRTLLGQGPTQSELPASPTAGEAGAGPKMTRAVPLYLSRTIKNQDL